ncbi:hypothetical protein CSUI_010678 [Cystoisospora suis]|uniref:Transmembrane protein n=1 Tax=Cystoisospora suis TaxID=483139 RepID=A0A2C6KFQ2_9APIC|nr:hypothetical protein CSUI_010678 [Cystoisospora suis]
MKKSEKTEDEESPKSRHLSSVGCMCVCMYTRMHVYSVCIFSLSTPPYSLDAYVSSFEKTSRATILLLLSSLSSCLSWLFLLLVTFTRNCLFPIFMFLSSSRPSLSLICLFF